MQLFLFIMNAIHHSCDFYKAIMKLRCLPKRYDDRALSPTFLFAIFIIIIAFLYLLAD